MRRAIARSRTYKSPHRVSSLGPPCHPTLSPRHPSHNPSKHMAKVSESSSHRAPDASGNAAVVTDEMAAAFDAFIAKNPQTTRFDVLAFAAKLELERLLQEEQDSEERDSEGSSDFLSDVPSEGDASSSSSSYVVETKRRNFKSGDPVWYYSSQDGRWHQGEIGDTKTFPVEEYTVDSEVVFIYPVLIGLRPRRVRFFASRNIRPR
ncbi:hypothetical protein BD414DRAFT_529683 [Trametes punicea]|nr:hypothetical protein BD414DRAFT_529683 [Trametes punicea]